MNRERRFGRLGRSVYDALVDATALCQSRQHQFVELDHWLWCLWQRETGDLHRFVNLLTVDSPGFSKRLELSINRLPKSLGGIRDLSGTLEHAVASALGWSRLVGSSEHVRSGHLLLACLEDVSIRRWLEGLLPELRSRTIDELVNLYEGDAMRWPEQGEQSVDGQSPVRAGEAAVPLECAASTEGLKRWATSLSDQAAQGELDPVVGRDGELRQVIDILLRRRQNNPILVGEAGVGKTAIAEGLAQRIFQGRVPAVLKGAQVWALDLGRMQAGAGARGEFEQRMRSVLDAVSASIRPVILFCDEVHMLVGAGGAAGTGDAANLIKPMLARGQLRMVAATTWSEYKQHIEPDAAFTRRFQPVLVEEPSDECALAMLRVIAARFARHHGVSIADGALLAAVELSRRHLPGRQLPDKAISLLDTACARVAMSQSAQPMDMDELGQKILTLDQELDWRANDAMLGLNVDAVAGEALTFRRDALMERMELMSQELTSQRGRVLSLLEEFSRSGRVDRQTQANMELLGELESARADLWVRPWVDAQVVASVLSEWTGVPSTHLATSDADRMLRLESDLRARIHGQDAALRQIIDALQIARADLNDPHRPLGVFLLAGPTGTGKTETAIALSDLLFGGAEHLIHFNMNEFQEAHSVSTLKGAPPGYVGYGKGGRLTEAVRRRPYSVVLLDEFDQAHRDVHEVFYQVFDKGWMEDGEGRRISFRNCLILLTTNLGAKEIETACELEPGIDEARLRGIVHQVLRNQLAPALLARMLVAGFRPLDREAMARIADRSIAELSDRLAEGGVALDAAGELRDWVAGVAMLHPGKGRAARDLLRQIAVPTIARGLLDARSQGRPLREVRLSASDKLEIEFVPAETVAAAAVPRTADGLLAQQASAMHQVEADGLAN